MTEAGNRCFICPHLTNVFDRDLVRIAVFGSLHEQMQEYSAGFCAAQNDGAGAEQSCRDRALNRFGSLRHRSCARPARSAPAVFRDCHEQRVHEEALVLCGHLAHEQQEKVVGEIDLAD